MQRNLSGLNNTYRSSIQLSLVDKASAKLKSIYRTFSRQKGALGLDISDGTMSRAQQFSNLLNSAFRTDDSKHWYEKIFGYLKGLIKYATMFGDALAGGFIAAGAAIQVAIAAVSIVLTKQIVKINAEMEQYQVSLQTTLHSLTKAKEVMADIVKFAKETPYEIKNITAAVVKLSAYNMNIDKWLGPLGDMASAFGRDITDAVEAAADAMTGMFRRALSYGIRMERKDFQQGGKYAGMEYGEAFLMEVQRRFAGGMELQAKTFKGIVSNIKDTLYIAFQQATRPAFESIKEIVSEVFDWLNKNSSQLGKYFDVVNKTVINLIDTARRLFKHLQPLVPVFMKLVNISIELWTTFRSVLSILLEAFIIPALVVIGKLAEMFVWLIDNAKWLLKIYIGYRVAILIFKALRIQVGAVATEMVAGGKAATMLSATLKTVATRVAMLAAAFAVMWIAQKFIEVRDNIKELAGALDDVAGGANNVKQYLKDLGKTQGFSTDEMAKAAVAAKDFGTNMQNVFEIGAQAAGASNLNIEVTKTIELLGLVSKAFIKEGESTDMMRQKTEEAAELLLYLKDNGEKLGLTWENITSNFDRYQEVLAKYGDNIEGLTKIITAFGLAAKAAGKDADLSPLFEELTKLMAPTKEMLLTMPADTWITRTTADLKDLSIALEQSDATLSAKYKSDYEYLEGIMKEYGIVAGAAKKAASTGATVIDSASDYAVQAATIVENKQIIGAKALISAHEKGIESAEAQEKAAKAQEAANKLPALRVNEPTTKTAVKVSIVDWAIDHPIAAGLSALVASYIVLKTMNKGINKLASIGAKAIKVQTAAAGTKLARFGLDYATKYAKPASLGMGAEETAQGRAWFAKRLLGMEDRLIRRTLPTDMLKKIEVATQTQVEILNTARNKAMDTMNKELAAAERKSFLKGGGRAKTLQSQMKVMNAQFDEAIKEIQKSYGELAKSIEKGKVPTALRSLADEIVKFTDNLGEASKGTTIAAKATSKAARSLSQSGKGIMGALFSIPLFGPGLKKIGRGFSGGGRLAPRVASVGAGTASVASSVSAVETGNIVKRFESQWIRRQFSKATGSILGPFKRGVSSGLMADEVYKPIVSAINSQTEITVNAFEKFGKVIPDEIGRQLTSIGAKPTQEFETMFEKFFAGRNIRTVSLGGITVPEVDTFTNKLTKAFSGATIKMPTTGPYALVGKEGLSAWMHEFMHTAQEGPGRTQGLAASTESSTKFLKELDAWQKVAKSLKAMGVDIRASATFMETATSSLKTYADKAGLSAETLDKAISSVIQKNLPEAAAKAATITRPTAAAATTIDRYAGAGIDKMLTQTSKAAAEAATKPVADAVAKYSARAISSAASKAINPALWATMAYEMQKGIRQLPGWEEEWKKTGAAMVNFEKKAGETDKEHLKRMQRNVSIYNGINTAGVKTADALEVVGGGLRSIFSPIEGIIMGFVDAAKGAELFSSIVKNTWTAAKGGAATAGRSIGDIAYGRGWEKKIATASTQKAYGQEIADYEDYVNKIQGIQEKADAQRILDSMKLAMKQKQMYGDAAKDFEEIYVERTLEMYRGSFAGGFKALVEPMAEGVKQEMRAKLNLAPTFEEAINIPAMAEKAKQAGEVVGQTIATGIDTAVRDIDISDEGITKMAEGMKEGAYSIEDVQAALKKMDDRLQHLDNQEIPMATKKVQEFEEQLGTLDRQVKKNEISLMKLGIIMTNISSQFDLSIAYNEMELVSDSVQAAEKEISRLNVTLAEQTMALTPLETKLKQIQNEYNEIKKSIDDAQTSMDKFLNAPIAGEGAYQDQLYEIDKQLAKLELDKIAASKGLKTFEVTGLTDSDTYKAAATTVTAIEAQVQALQDKRDELEKNRQYDVMDIEHAKEVAQRQEEMTGAQITDGVAAAKAVIDANKPRLEQLQIELDNQQTLVDRKNAEIEATNIAITAHEREVELIRKKVDYANQDVAAAKAKMEASKKIYDLEGAITELGMVQVAQAMAKGQISTAAMEKLVADYNAAARTSSEFTRTNIGLQNQIQEITFDKEAWDKILADAQAEQGVLIDKINTLVSTAESLITGVNAEGEGFKTALTAIFGTSAGRNLSDIARATLKMASMSATAPAGWSRNEAAASVSRQYGGIVTAAKQLVLAHGPEAFVPLKGGAIPVTLSGIKTSGGTTTNIEIGQIVVRDDNDLEEIKSAILALRQGQTSFFSKPNQYPERH